MRTRATRNELRRMDNDWVAQRRLFAECFAFVEKSAKTPNKTHLCRFFRFEAGSILEGSVIEEYIIHVVS